MLLIQRWFSYKNLNIISQLSLQDRISGEDPTYTLRKCYQTVPVRIQRLVIGVTPSRILSFL